MGRVNPEKRAGVKALWLLPQSAFEEAGFDTAPENTLLQSPLASVRLRTAVAASAWRAHGYGNGFLDPEHPDARGVYDATGVRLGICGKFFGDLDIKKWLDACLRVKDQGAPLVLDISDFPEGKERFYDQALQICDVITVNSVRMAELMASKTSRRCYVIEDAILSAPRKPEFSPGKVLQLLWFGHPSNLRYLDSAMGALVTFSARRACSLTIVTASGRGIEESLLDLNTRLPAHFRVRFVPWSIESTRVALRKCDVVLIPGDPADARKAGVSSNRIAEAINAGRFPIANALDSYLPFSDVAYLGHDLAAGIAAALANPGETLAKIRRGQALVAERLSAEKIGNDWVDCMEQVAGIAQP